MKQLQTVSLAIAATLTATVVIAAPPFVKKIEDTLAPVRLEARTTGDWDIIRELETMMTQIRSGEALSEQVAPEAPARFPARLSDSVSTRLDDVPHASPGPGPSIRPSPADVLSIVKKPHGNIKQGNRLKMLQQLDPSLLPRAHAGQISPEEWKMLYGKWSSNKRQGKYLPYPHNVYPGVVVVEPADFKAFVQRETGIDRTENEATQQEPATKKPKLGP